MSGNQTPDATNDNSRLAVARRKLDRLETELEQRTEQLFDHYGQTHGSPVNDKSGAASFNNRAAKIEEIGIRTYAELEQQRERVERLEEAEARKAAGLNRSGGIDITLENLDRLKEEVAKGKDSSYRPETLKRYEREIARLEKMQDVLDAATITPGAQQLIDEGHVKQWAKQPATYFVKGLRKVALELNESGEFGVSSQPKFNPYTEEATQRVNQLLEQQAAVNQEATAAAEFEPITVTSDRTVHRGYSI